MTTGALELSKFQRKAEAYRRALNIAPHARSLEVVPLLAYLKGLCSALGLRRSELRIVDFMSGDGHLSRILYGQGYRKIVAIESCNEMSFGSKIYEKVKLVNAPDAVSGLRIIGSYNPHVVVSLAAFHHLLEVGSDSKIDLVKSVEVQSTIVVEAFRAAPSLLLFMIVDLAEAKSGHWGLDRWDLWQPLSSHESENLDGPHHDKLRDIYHAPSFAGFVSAIDQTFLTQPVSTFSLPWFRDVVDPGTETGHKDAALSDHLVTTLEKSFTVSYRKFACPWHFDGDEQLGVYLQEKFGFSLASRKSPDQVRCIARSRNLILGRDGMESFLWDLGMLVVERPGLKFPKRSVVDRYYVFPLAFVAFAVAAVTSKSFFYNAEMYTALSNAAFVMAGATLKMLFFEAKVEQE